MLRRLFRLLIIGLLIALIAYAASRLMGGDEDDLDDFDDLDSEFEFQETPVEIDVAASDVTPASATTDSTAQSSTGTTGARSNATNMSTGLLHDHETATSNGGGRLIDINGIGPAYEARLHTIGINSIHDLANADPEMIASQIEVIGGAATVGDWIDQAKSYQSNGQS